jgi:hypothetical protein
LRLAGLLRRFELSRASLLRLHRLLILILILFIAGIRWKLLAGGLLFIV